ncbi:MAG: phospholipid carrier-dependent glycosyltransferase [Clostridia bacterium]|nr:phospholipid carrier-dependent glycosyltransferase [Clostridia bacterium]
MTFNIILSLAFLIFSLLLCRFNKEKLGGVKNRNFYIALSLVFFLSFILRIFLGYHTEGFETDLYTFKAWGNILNTTKWDEIYSLNTFIDYPPGYLYILGGLDKLRIDLGIGMYDEIFTLMIKLPSIIADMVTGVIIYFLGKKRVGEFNSLLISAAYLFCPAVLVNSAVWGQADSFTALLLLVSVILLYKDRVFPAAAVYGLGVICKPQMLIFAPLFIFALLYRKKFIKLIFGVLLSLGVILLVALPFTKNFDFTWLFKRYINTIDFYAYYSINAFNFWGMIGYNWKSLPIHGIGASVLGVIGPLIAVVLSGILLFKKRLSEKYFFNEKYKAVYFACPALLMFTVYIFSVKMHERYLFPALLFILLSYIFTKDKRFLLTFAGTAFVHFLNVSYILYLNNDYLSPTAPELIIISALHLVIYFHFIYVLYSVFKKDKVVKKINLNILKIKPETKLSLFPEKKKPFDKKDLIIAVVITVFYSIFALSNVGSTKVVDSAWVPYNGDSVVIKTDGVIDRLLYLPGIDVNIYENENGIYRGSRTGAHILIETSKDGENWEKLHEAETPYVYCWQEVEIFTEVKYLRLTSTNFNTTIGEIGAFYMGNQVPLTLIKGEGAALLDEQASVPSESTWENSTYFDEIYHARSAYEYILRAEPYENTHPTLGKLIISLGILIFGMSPFGFRIMGVLFGILMLPVLYHLLRKFFDSKLISGVCTLIFAFDFMHFTQTRIATIDTYAVFFILLMFDFMVSFISMDIYKEKLIKLLAPLFFSGLFMGLGVSAKWNVAYAALGLAVLYFAKIILSYLDKKKELDDKQKTEGGVSVKAKGKADSVVLQGEKHKELNRPVILSLFCVLFFVVIPFGIYFASFLVCTLLPQNTYNIFERFMAYQKHMLDYHANLEASHYFESPFYEWPFDVQNIWYYGDSNLKSTVNASTIVCLGNPITWWAGFVAIVILLIDLIRKKAKGMAAVMVGFLSAYLPWVVISRLTFIYHYFTAVPFIIIALGYVFNKLSNMAVLNKPIINKGVLAKIRLCDFIAVSFLIISLIMFVIFYPAISGAESNYYYLKSLEWLPEWYFI